MQYELLFDLGQQQTGEAFWLLLGSAILIPATWLRVRRTRQGGATAMPTFMMLFGAVALACGLITIWDHQRLLNHLQAGRVEIAEGLVASHSVESIARYDHQAKRYNRSEWEAFLVGTIAFGFTRDASAVGFKNGAEPRVQLRDGEWLRIAYVEDVAGDFSQRRILRLERGCLPGDCVAHVSSHVAAAR
jgi:hypothetical protein